LFTSLKNRASSFLALLASLFGATIYKTGLALAAKFSLSNLYLGGC